MKVWNLYTKFVKETLFNDIDIPEPQFFEVTEATEWYWAAHDSPRPGWGSAPNVAPPFPVLWLESKGLFPESGRAGCLLFAEKNSDGWKIILDVCAVCYGLPVLQYVEIEVSPTGQPIRAAFGELVGLRNNAPSSIVDNYQALLDYWLAAFCYAISFINCKNVEAVDADPPPPALAKKRARLGRESFVEHKILKIGRPRHNSHRSDNESNINTALHLCRGHFKTYTPERPLLGKAIGTFWFDSHVRGSQEIGEVHKTYSVGVPEPKVPRA